MKLDLGLMIHNMFHFRTNELGHNAAGNALVDTMNATVSPLVDGAVSQATGGLISAGLPTPAAPLATDGSHVTIPALATLALIVGGPHTTASTPAASVTVPPAAPTMESIMAQMALLQQQLAALQASPPTMAAPPPIGASSL